MSDEIIPIPITPPPGVVKAESIRTVEGRWSNTEKMRFAGGKPEKIGGWTRQTLTAMAGSPRTLHAWRDNSSLEYIGAGTYKKLYVVDRSFTVYDITPFRSSGTLLGNPFSVTASSAAVLVGHSSHGLRLGDAAHYSGAVTAGGILIDGEYTITGIITLDNYTILHSTAATVSTGGGGTSVHFDYEITIGGLFGVYGLGYGVGGYGLLGYGEERTISTVFIEPRVWSLDHFGQILLASYNEGALYFWDPSVSSATSVRAAVVADAPTDIRFMFITPERFVICLCDEMEIKWSAQGNYTVFTPTSLNTAGIRRVTEGTKLVGGRSLSGGIALIWSDSALYLHQYNGSFLVFETRLAGRNCGLISPSAAITVGSVAFWISHSCFLMYDGQVKRIPNVEDVRAYIYDQLDPAAGYLCSAAYVSQFNEVWFFISTQSSTEPSLYAIVCLEDFSWATGTMTRVSSTFFQHGDTRPYWAADDGYIYLHEDGHDANGEAMEASVTLAPAGLEKGKRLMDIEGIEPDFFEQNGEITMTINTWDRIRDEDDTPLDSSEHTVQATDGLVDLRLQGRYAGMTVLSNTLGGYFRMGSPTVYVKADGTRR